MAAVEPFSDPKRASLDVPTTRPTQTKVSLKYLGTSDEFDFGDGVVAVRGGEPVEVDRELADKVTVLPHDKFEEVGS